MYLVLVRVSLFSLCSSIFLWSGTFFILSFSSLFPPPFVWLTLFLLLFDVLSCCVLLILFPVQMLFNWSLLVWVLFTCVWFQSVLECHPEVLWLCVCPTDPRGIAQLSSMLASDACCSLWSVDLYLLHIWYVICCCGYGCPFLLLYHGSIFHDLCIEPLQ